MEIRNLQAASGKTYGIGRLSRGDYQYEDRLYQFDFIPDELNGQLHIKTHGNDKLIPEDQACLTFECAEPVEVFVLYPDKQPCLPHWLQAFERRRLNVTRQDSMPGNLKGYFSLYSRIFPAGTVALGGNSPASMLQQDWYVDTMGANYCMYSVCVKPANLPAPAVADTCGQAIRANTVPSVGQLAASQFVSFDRVRPGSRVLFVGNSITRHAPKPEIGWTDHWGMAASALEKDYVHLLIRKIRSQDAGAEFCIAQLANWERQYWQGPAILEQYRDAAAFDPDVIIMRVAENVPRDLLTEHPFASSYEELLNFLDPTHRARVIITTSFWPAAGVDEAIREVAHRHGYPLVELGELGLQDAMKAVGLFEHTGVANHPGDAGMAAIAEAIWNLLR